jgi:endonuclease YncB( thermonuclease family)
LRGPKLFKDRRALDVPYALAVPNEFSLIMETDQVTRHCRVILIATVPALADDLAGQASVIDGDTLEIHGTRIRLWGIDAPESSQLCRGEDSLQYRCGARP